MLGVREVKVVLNQHDPLPAKSKAREKHSQKASAVFATVQLSGDQLQAFCFRKRASAKARKLLCSQLATRARRRDLRCRRGNSFTLSRGAARAIPS